MSWNLACPDWEARLKGGKSLVPDLPLYREEGERAVAVFNKLRLFDVHGTPTMAEAGADWFRDIVRALFGSLNPVTRHRMIREVFLLVPKKNNKTTGGALLMLTALLLNQRPGAPFLLTAPVQKTADDAFLALAGAIALDPVLDKKLHVRDHLKTVIHRETKAKLEIMTFDPEIVTGKKVVGGLIDELHVLGKASKARRAMVQLRGGMQPFPEAFLVTITTQSDEAPAGVFRDDLIRAREIRDGKRQGATLPVLYEFPEAMQQDPSKPWRDPANWPMVTPNLGRSVHLESLKQAFVDEEAKGDAAMREWASQHLNVEIGLALQSNAWAAAEFWEQQVDRTITLESLIARSEVIAIGGDGGGLDDLLGLCVIGREKATGQWLVWAHAWAHRSVLTRRKSEAPRLEDLAASGNLTIIETRGQDASEFADACLQVHASGKLFKIGLDPYGAGAIQDGLEQAGIPRDLIEGISQGWKLTGAIKTAERKLADGVIVHDGSALMKWCVGNAKVEPRGNAILITKQASGTAKIDPLMAMFDAVQLMALNPAPPGAKFQLFVV